MTDRPVTGPVPRVTLRREEAAASLGISVDAFDDHVRPHLRSVGVGRLPLYSVQELERWALNNATSVRDDVARARRAA